MQPDLFRTPLTDLALTPEPGRAEPRLWVTRLVIWRDQGVVVRDIPLRPGLNVVWSPDAATDGSAIGHGAGKTTFCRLLRYCLGEDSFAPQAQRRATFDQMPNGGVGAEVRLAGRDWAIIRRFHGFHEDWAIPDVTLGIADALGEPTGIAPFRAAASQILLGDAVKLFPRSLGESGGWPAVLAWLTRDQECRFSHLLDWRDKDSDSQSPVRKGAAADRLTVVRAVLGAITADELATEEAREAQAESLRGVHLELARLDWWITNSRRELAAALGFDVNQPASELDAAALIAAAEARLTKASGAPLEATPASIKAARSEQDQLTLALSAKQSALQSAVVRADEKEKLVKVLEAELPSLSAQGQMVDVCPLCYVPIDKVLAEGCGISLQSCDTEAVRARITAILETREREKAEMSALRSSLPSLKADVALTQQHLERQRDAVNRLINAALSRTSAVQHARDLLGEARRHRDTLSVRDAKQRQADAAEAELKRLKDSIDSLRGGTNDMIIRLSERCDVVARSLIPGEISARAKLDGNGLDIVIEMGGNRNTPAISSLKVAIFDLAMLTLSMEGQTRFPGFLIHDSPREADLDLAVYHRLFAFGRTLETFGPARLFQYIVTTTTTPPEDILNGDASILTLHGAPASERLLTVNL